jgi:hypothetical protein
MTKRYAKHEIQRLSKRKDDTKRERNFGAVGRPFKLGTRDRFLLLLVYCRLYITYTLSDFLFDLDQSTIYRDIQKIEYWILNMIRKRVPIPQKIYNVTKRLKIPEDVETYFLGFIAFIDCTEQQIPRPMNKRKRKIFYSGKKKRHTVKNQLMVNNHGYIIHKARNKKERWHDYDIYKENHPITPKQVVNVGDLGYLGIEKDFPDQLSALPYKKRNQELSIEEKEYNQIHSKKRMIVIEHTICQLKKYRILSDVFRNKLRKYDRVSDIVVGLVNYRITNQYW